MKGRIKNENNQKQTHSQKLNKWKEERETKKKHASSEGSKVKFILVVGVHFLTFCLSLVFSQLQVLLSYS